jgi:hypothetical protein
LAIARPAYLADKVYPLPHNKINSFDLSAYTGSRNCTLYPLVSYDEARIPANINTHPEHASFAEYDSPNCAPDSKINRNHTTLELSLTKHCWNIDKVEALKVYVVPVMLSFKDNYTAIDELTSVEVQDVLEMQTEATDRQGYPIWSGTKLNGDLATLGIDVVGLTTNQTIEMVAFDMDLYYDALQYYTIGPKLAKSTGNVKALTVKRGHPTRMKIHIPSKAKRMNEYTFFGVIIYVPTGGNVRQYSQSGDFTDTDDHVICKVTHRFLEWNRSFDSERA